MRTDLVLTFTSPDRPGIVEELTKAVVSHAGNWEESRSSRLCGDFAGIARVTIPTEQQEALCRALERLSEKDLLVQVKIARPESDSSGGTRASLTCTGADHEGIVSSLTSRLVRRGINVEEMETSISAAPTTGIPLFEMRCQIQLPAKMSTAEFDDELRELEQELAVEIELDL